MNRKQLQTELAYHKEQLFRIAMSFNPDHVFGPGLKNQLLRHRAEIERLESLLQ